MPWPHPNVHVLPAPTDEPALDWPRLVPSLPGAEYVGAHATGAPYTLVPVDPTWVVDPTGGAILDSHPPLLTLSLPDGYGAIFTTALVPMPFYAAQMLWFTNPGKICGDLYNFDSELPQFEQPPTLEDVATLVRSWLRALLSPCEAPSADLGETLDLLGDTAAGAFLDTIQAQEDAVLNDADALSTVLQALLSQPLAS